MEPTKRRLCFRSLSLGTLALLVPLAIAVMFTKIHVRADNPDFGGGSSGSDAAARVSDLSNVSGNGTDTTTLFRAPKDNRRVRWYWSPELGWQSIETEETYEKGWMWVWRDGEWSWEQLSGGHAAAPHILTKDVQSTKISDDMLTCFDHAGKLTTDRASCSKNQRDAARLADDAQLPSDLQSIVRDIAPYDQGEETRVLYALRIRFEDSAVAVRRNVVNRAVSDVVSKLGILKNLDSVTDTEKQYFISRIAAVQNLADEEGMDSSEAVLEQSAQLSGIVHDVSTFMQNHNISVIDPTAPTADRILSDARRMIDALPAAFSALDDAGFSTTNLRSMHAGTVTLYDEVSVSCRQGRECSRVRDVVEELAEIVATLNSMVSASGDSLLKAEVQKRFDAAMGR